MKKQFLDLEMVSSVICLENYWYPQVNLEKKTIIIKCNCDSENVIRIKFLEYKMEVKVASKMYLFDYDSLELVIRNEEFACELKCDCKKIYITFDFEKVYLKLLDMQLIFMLSNWFDYVSLGSKELIRLKNNRINKLSSEIEILAYIITDHFDYVSKNKKVKMEDFAKNYNDLVFSKIEEIQRLNSEIIFLEKI